MNGLTPLNVNSVLLKDLAIRAVFAMVVRHCGSDERMRKRGSRRRRRRLAGVDQTKLSTCWLGWAKLRVTGVRWVREGRVNQSFTSLLVRRGVGKWVVH